LHDSAHSRDLNPARHPSKAAPESSTSQATVHSPVVAVAGTTTSHPQPAEPATAATESTTEEPQGVGARELRDDGRSEAFLSSPPGPQTALPRGEQSTSAVEQPANAAAAGTFAPSLDGPPSPSIGIPDAIAAGQFPVNEVFAPARAESASSPASQDLSNPSTAAPGPARPSKLTDDLQILKAPSDGAPTKQSAK